jgi:hypothetical protein
MDSSRVEKHLPVAGVHCSYQFSHLNAIVLFRTEKAMSVELRRRKRLSAGAGEAYELIVARNRIIRNPL